MSTYEVAIEIVKAFSFFSMGAISMIFVLAIGYMSSLGDNNDDDEPMEHF